MHDAWFDTPEKVDHDPVTLAGQAYATRSSCAEPGANAPPSAKEPLMVPEQ